MPRNTGMTLIELVIVILIAGIVASISTSFIVTATTGYSDLVRRAKLVDAAEMSLRLIARDIRRALPNSVRVRDASGNTENVTCSTAGTTCAIEMLNIVDGGRYREGPGQVSGGHNHASPQYRLSFTGADSNGFNIVGTFQSLAVPFSSTTEHLAVYNQGATGADAYADGDESQAAPTTYVMTRSDTTTFSVADDGGGDEHQILPVMGNFRFATASPNQRVYIVDTLRPTSATRARAAPSLATELSDPNHAANRYAVAPLVSGSNQLLTTR